MSTKKKKVGILDWFGSAQKKMKTQDGCSTLTTPLLPPIDPSTQETETETGHDTSGERDHFNVNYIPRDPELRLNIFYYNPNVQDLYDWLEYSVDKDATYCFVCYLFKNKDDHVADTFVKNGLKGWNRPVAFDKHVRKFNSAHNQAREKYDALTTTRKNVVGNYI
ncbi:zinc finger MYM-type protein 1-like protein [Tanacetum coccineum]